MDEQKAQEKRVYSNLFIIGSTLGVFAVVPIFLLASLFPSGKGISFGEVVTGTAFTAGAGFAVGSFFVLCRILFCKLKNRKKC